MFTTPVMAPSTEPAAPLMPFTRPVMMFVPMEKSLEGADARAETMLVRRPDAAEATEPIIPLIPLEKKETALEPRPMRVEGRFAMTLTIPSTSEWPADDMSPTSALAPSARAVTALLPRSAHENALHTSTTAWMICGMFSTSVGKALMSPSPSVTMIWTAASRILGALSLMHPAMFETISGTCSMMDGMPSASPWASPRASCMAASAMVPTFSRRDSESCSIIDRPLSMSCPPFSER